MGGGYDLVKPSPLITLLAFLLLAASAHAQSVSLPTDRARVTVASIPDPYGGPNLKVLRTDANTPLRAGTAWIWEKQRQEEPASYYANMRSKGLNSVRMILFDTWEVEAYTPGLQFTPTDWNNAAYRTRQLARMERSVNYASANGMYVIINSHNKNPNYNEAYVNALWTHVAPYFANRTHVLYELANEPMSGIGINGDMDMGGNAQNSSRLQALRRGYNIARARAPDTHLMILTPPGINDSAYGTGMGNVAASFAALPGVAVDWAKTYHLALTYTRPTLIPDVNYQVEWSETLATASWSAAPVQQLILADDGLTRTIQARAPIDANPHGFLRLKVTQRP